MVKRILVLILLLVFGLMPSRGAALCVAEGGHIALEFIISCELDDIAPACDANPKIDLCFDCDDTDKSEDCTDVAVPADFRPDRSTTNDALAAHFLLATIPTGVVARSSILLQALAPSFQGTAPDHPVLPPSIQNTASVVLTV